MLFHMTKENIDIFFFKGLVFISVRIWIRTFHNPELDRFFYFAMWIRYRSHNQSGRSRKNDNRRIRLTMVPDPDPGGPRTYGSDGSGFGS
jgi:hypothetical protein